MKKDRIHKITFSGNPEISNGRKPSKSLSIDLWERPDLMTEEQRNEIQKAYEEAAVDKIYLDELGNEISQATFFRKLFEKGVAQSFEGYEIKGNTIRLLSLEEIMKLRDGKE